MWLLAGDNGISSLMVVVKIKLHMRQIVGSYKKTLQMDMTQIMTWNQWWRTVKLTNSITSADTLSPGKEEQSCQTTCMKCGEQDLRIFRGTFLFTSLGSRSKEEIKSTYHCIFVEIGKRKWQLYG